MRMVRVDGELWAAASVAADALGYRSVDVYIEDCLRRLAHEREREPYVGAPGPASPPSVPPEPLGA